MKTLCKYFVLMLITIMVEGCTSQSQTCNEKTIQKTIKKELRSIQKEGWKWQMESPLEYRLKEVYYMRGEMDNKGYKKYIEGESRTVGETYNAAHAVALNASKFELAGKIETEIAELIAKRLYCPIENAIELSKSLESCKSLVVNKLNRVCIPVELYRVLPNGYVEVRVISFFPRDFAMDIYKQIWLEELEKKDDSLAKQIDRLLKF